jgi:hypothetical protein
LNVKSSRTCPPDFAPDKTVYATARKVGLNEEEAVLELEKLRDHEFRRAHSDWMAVARNWMRNAASFKGRFAPKRDTIGRNDWRPTEAQRRRLEETKMRLVGRG